MTKSHNNEPNPHFNRIHLFLIRVWHEPGSDGSTQWHGRLQRVVSGETHPFESLDRLTALLEELAPPKAHPAHTQEEQIDTSFAAQPGLDEPEPPR